MAADWVFDGGRGCVDLVNTVRERHLDGRELLTDPSALAEWLLRAGLVPGPVRATAGDLTAARDLREAIDRLTRAADRQARPAAADVRLVNRTAAAVPAIAPQLRFDRSGQPSLRKRPERAPVTAALATLATDAVELVGAGGAVRICAAEDCGLRFVDSSPKGNRQWCSMARCGNRAKARAHYVRTRRA